MGEEHGVGMERLVGSLGNYFVDDNRKQGLKVDYAYYRERNCIRFADHRRALKEVVVNELPREVAEEPAIAAADAAAVVAYEDETDTDCRSCKS